MFICLKNACQYGVDLNLENPTFWGSCILTGVSITTVVGPFAIMELCTRGIELGYMHRMINGIVVIYRQPV